MAYDERLANRIRQVLEGRNDVTERKMFGGLAFLRQGRMCCGIVGNDLMVRIPHDEFEDILRRRHVRPMDFTGRPLKGFVYVSPSGFRTAASLRSWLSYGERVVCEEAARSRKRSPSPRNRTQRRRTRPSGAC